MSERLKSLLEVAAHISDMPGCEALKEELVGKLSKTLGVLDRYDDISIETIMVNYRNRLKDDINRYLSHIENMEDVNWHYFMGNLTATWKELNGTCPSNEEAEFIQCVAETAMACLRVRLGMPEYVDRDQWYRPAKVRSVDIYLKELGIAREDILTDITQPVVLGQWEKYPFGSLEDIHNNFC